MENNKVINVVNFLRSLEPRLPMDLHEAPIHQMELAKKHRLPTTWLLQYDTMLDGWYSRFLLENMPADHELGVWFEIPRALVEKAGLEWRGRWDWDWHTHVGFSLGYAPRDRERMADIVFEEFRKQFGRYPRVFGSWVFDAHLFGYLADRYGLDAGCICKDQWGTDGYTMWGGYWANGYYPSRKNINLPAAVQANQIDVPVFRMLGSDPIYQYDATPEQENGQSVVTMEPVYTHYGSRPAGGGAPSWVDWFLRENFRDPVMAMGYCQIGQENPFGWPRMADGLTDQYEKVAHLRDAGVLTIETLGSTGRRFRKSFAATPMSSVAALADWAGNDRSSIWALNRLMRVNLVRDADRTPAIRDWQMYSDDYAEPYLDGVCATPDCVFDALSIFDGMRWHRKHQGRIRFAAGESLAGRFAAVTSPDADTLIARWETDAGKSIAVTIRENTVAIDSTIPDLRLEFDFDVDPLPGTTAEIVSDRMNFVHVNGNARAAYALCAAGGARFEGKHLVHAAGAKLSAVLRQAKNN